MISSLQQFRGEGRTGLYPKGKDGKEPTSNQIPVYEKRPGPLQAPALCSKRSAACDGLDLRSVYARIPMRVNRFEVRSHLWCAGCRRSNKGCFKYDQLYGGENLV